MILCLGGEKGGVGKTSIATHFAYMRQAAGRDVCLIDADPQWSSTDFCAARDQEKGVARISSIQKTGKGLAAELQALAEKYDDLIIDTGGRDSMEFRIAVLVSDILLVPINASAFNWWTLSKVDEIIGTTKLQNADLRAEIVLNRLPGNPGLRRRKLNTATDRLHAAEFDHLKVCQAVLVERTAFSDNEEFGLTVFEPSRIKPMIDGLACQEITALYEEVFGERFSVSAPAA